MNKIFIIIVAIIIIIGSIYIYKRYTKKEEIKTEMVEIFYFYTQWCPYCKKARVDWDNFKNQWEGKTHKGIKLIFTEVDCDRNESIADKYKVINYPTIKLLKGNEIIEYDAKPNIDTLNQFLESSL